MKQLMELEKWKEEYRTREEKREQLMIETAVRAALTTAQQQNPNQNVLQGEGLALLAEVLRKTNQSSASSSSRSTEWSKLDAGIKQKACEFVRNPVTGAGDQQRRMSEIEMRHHMQTNSDIAGKPLLSIEGVLFFPRMEDKAGIKAKGVISKAKAKGNLSE